MLTSIASWSQSSNDTGISSQLNASPNDVNQLLSFLQQEKYSLIRHTPLTPYLDQYEARIKELKNKYGIDFGMNYIPLVEYSGAGNPHDNASGENFEFFGRFMPKSLQSSKTTFAIKVDETQSYTEITPGAFSRQINTIIRTTSGYIPYNLAVTELWVEQSVIRNLVTYRLGKINISNVMNTYAFSSRRFYFLSNVFSSHPSTAVPTDSLGAVVGISLTQHLYTAVGLLDAEGRLNTSGFSTVFKGHYFTSVEVGYRDIIVNPQSDNYHVFLWHVDARPELARPSGEGLSIVLQKNFKSQFIPFIKLDWNKNNAALFNKLFISGFGLEHPFHEQFGLLGLATGFAELSERKGVNQWIVEAFYRMQLTRYSQLTPDMELIHPLPLNNTHGVVAVFNLRYRIAV